MIDRITPSTAPETPSPSPSRRPTPATSKSSEFKLEAVDTLPGGVPATPPTEVLYALDRAQSVIAELASRQVNMRISVDEETDRIRSLSTTATAS